MRHRSRTSDKDAILFSLLIVGLLLLIKLYSPYIRYYLETDAEGNYIRNERLLEDK